MVAKMETRMLSWCTTREVDPASIGEITVAPELACRYMWVPGGVS